MEFFRYDSTSGAWELPPITVTDTLLHAKDADGSTGALLTAAAVAAKAPSEGSWYAEVTDTELSINADFLYPTARWVPLLEKAYAQYVERYGQYGGGPDTAKYDHKRTDDQGNPRSGYEIMEGGQEQFVYALFYAWAVAPGNWPVLDPDQEQGAFRGLQELLLVAAQLGNDSGGGQKHVYAEHVYTVTGATFLDADGKDPALTLQNYETEARRIDPAKSTVDLRNPHGKNEPNPSGVSREEDGCFSLTLEQFISAFSNTEPVGVKR